MPLLWDIGISSLVLAISTLLALCVGRKWARRREEIRRLVLHASQEAARAELEASAELSSVSSAFQCPVCYCPASTRCSRCKAVRYCSGKCQIIHWRQGHKDECRAACITLDDLVDKEEAVSVAETSGSSFSGFSSSPRHDSSDDETFSSSHSDTSEFAHAPSSPLSPNFLHLLQSVDTLTKPARDQSQSTVPDPSSSDFWGTTLGQVKSGGSSLHFSFASSTDTSPLRLEDAPGHVLGTKTERSHNSQLSSKSTASLSPLDTTILSTVTLRKSEDTSSESGCMLVPLKVGEGQLLASKASNTSHCADFLKPSPLGAKYETVLDHQKRNGVAFHSINSQHGRSGFQASLLKATRPKSSAENEMAQRPGHKGLSPYEFFVKLYRDKSEFQPCGLMNCGNSCFANVVFQCLMFTPPLTTYFLQQFHSRSCPDKDQCFTCGFENLVLKAREGKSPLSPNSLLSRLHNTGIFLGNGKQEDAHEFLRFVVGTMQSVCIKASEHNMPKTRKLEDSALIDLTFGGYLRSKIKCMKCQGKSVRSEKMMDLTVEIDGDISTLDDALRRFTSTEVLDGENKYICSRCKSYERAKKKLKIMEPPNVLTIALKRFQSGKFGKLNKLIRFPETLDLAPYVSGGSDKSHEYKLYGVIVHLDIMNAAFSGHYVCYIRNGQNKWFKADDSTIVTSEVEGILTKGAYMLFYARCSPRLVCAKTEASDKKSSIPIPKANKKAIASTSRLLSTSNGQSGNIQSFYSSFQRLQRILENDSSSDSSSLFDSNSDECSCSTDSTSTDFSDFICGDNQGRAGGKSDAPSPINSYSSSPLLTNHCLVSDSAPSPKICVTSRNHRQ